MSLRRVRSVEEPVQCVRHAVFEVAELRDCLAHDAECMGKLPAFSDLLEEGIDAVPKSMQAGTYTFRAKDLFCMDLAGRQAGENPFRTLLKQINETHRRGLAVEGDDAWRDPSRSAPPQAGDQPMRTRA